MCFDVYDMFYLPENASTAARDYDSAQMQWIRSAKLEIVQRAKAENIPLISCMVQVMNLNITPSSCR